MFGWLEGLIGAMADALGSVFEIDIANTIWNSMIQWFYETIYLAVAEFFTLMGNMGAELFELNWVKATIMLFTLFGWSLFSAGVVVAAFDVAIEYQNGRANIKTTMLNVLKGFFACSLIGVLPVELYKFCISLQNTFARDLAQLFAGEQMVGLGDLCGKVLLSAFTGTPLEKDPLVSLLTLIAFAYCIIKVFFQNIKRGGILLIQMVVGSLYMFSVPRGYSDGFVQWVKQVIATCLTAFLQTTMLYLGLITFESNKLLGLGVMLAANEVPRIAQQFGLDSSTKINAMSVVYGASSAVNLTKNIIKATGK